MPNKLPGFAALVQAENEGRIKSPDDLGRMAESCEDPQIVLDDIRRIDRALNTPSSALKEIREWKARAAGGDEMNRDDWDAVNIHLYGDTRNGSRYASPDDAARMAQHFERHNAPQVRHDRLRDRLAALRPALWLVLAVGGALLVMHLVTVTAANPAAPIEGKPW